MDIIRNILTFVGLITIVGVVLGFTLVLVNLCIEEIRTLNYKQKIKRRFNKPPTAKCYCKDCVYWRDDGYCQSITDWYTADNWFCWRAEPRKTDPDKAKVWGR